MKTVIRRAAMALGALIGAGSLFAETFVWTGAEDAYWTNAANWTVSGAAASRCPSALIGADDAASWTAWTNDTDAAQFDATGAARTTINLDGLFSVKTILITGADAPVYTFGLAGQTLPMRAGGTFTLDSSVTHAPVFTCAVATGVGAVKGASSTTYTSINFVNNSSVQMRLGDMDTGVRNPQSPTGYDYYYGFAMSGDGDFALTGTFQAPVSSFVYISNYGLVTVEHDMTFKNLALYDPSGRKQRARLYINEGVTFGVYRKHNNGILVTVSRGLETYGPGTFALMGIGGSKDSGSKEPYISYLSIANERLKVSSGFTVYDGQPFYTKGVDSTIVEFTDEADNQLTAPLFWYGSAFTICAESIGANGEKSSIGTASNIYLAKGGTLAYTGAGETTTRTITLTNLTYTSKSVVYHYKADGTLSHQGTGPWTVSSEIVPQYHAETPSSVLTLDNATAFPATLTSTLTDGEKALALKKTGSGLWIINAANTYTGPTTVSAGTLELAATGAIDSSSSVTIGSGAELVLATNGTTVARTLKNLSADTGVAKVTVGAGVTLTLDGVPTATNGGRLDITAADGASIVCPDGASQILPYAQVRLNDNPVSFDSDGRMQKAVYTPTTRVDVRGGVIASDASAHVGFNDAGDAGTVTLGATTVAVAGLVQDLETASATVTFAAGQTLAAPVLALAEDATNLTVGADRSTGSVTVPTEGLYLENDSTNGELAVRAPLAVSGTLPIGKGGVGAADLPLATAFTTALTVRDGLLNFSDGSDTVVGFSKPEGAETPAAATFKNTTTTKTLTHATEDALVVSGTIPEAKKMALTVSAGEVAFSGSGVKGIGNASLAKGATLKIENGAEVQSYGTDTFIINGRFEIENGTHRNTTAGTFYSDCTYGTLTVQGSGLLIVGENGNCSNRVNSGYANGGAVKQTGGNLYVISHKDGSSSRCSNFGYNCPGFFLKTGGYLYNNAYFWLNDGLIEHAGGTARIGKLCYSGLLYANAAARPHFLLSGGTVETSSELCMGWHDSASMQTALTIDGEGAVLDLHGSDIRISQGTSGSVNLNKGILKAAYIQRVNSAKGYYNFNGGTFLCQASSYTIFNSPTRATVYENGLTIDLNDLSGCIHNATLYAPAGNGVEEVPMTATTDWAAAPTVDIEGDGEGATACVRYDPETRTVSGIRVTSRGWNYTTAEAVLKVNYVEKARYACTLTPNKRGPLTITSSNHTDGKSLNFAFGGSNEVSKIRLEHGNLSVNSAAAVLPDVELELAASGNHNGINFYSWPVRLASLGGTPDNCRFLGTQVEGKIAVTVDHPSSIGLTGTIYNAITLTDVGAWNLTPAEIKGWNADPSAPTCPVYDWDYTFADTASVVVSTPVGLDPKVRYTLFRVSDGHTLTGCPTLSFASGDEPCWKLEKKGRALILRRKNGLAVLIR